MIHAVDPHGSFFKFFNRIPFIMQIVLGMILGIILAYLIPQGQSFITMLGDLFVSGLRQLHLYWFLCWFLHLLPVTSKALMLN